MGRRTTSPFWSRTFCVSSFSTSNRWRSTGIRCRGPVWPLRSITVSRRSAYAAAPPARTTTSRTRSPCASSKRCTIVALPATLVLLDSDVPVKAPRTSTTSWSTDSGGTNSASPGWSGTSAGARSAVGRSSVSVSLRPSAPTRVSRASAPAAAWLRPPTRSRSAASEPSGPISYSPGRRTAPASMTDGPFGGTRILIPSSTNGFWERSPLSSKRSRSISA